jgi:diguanylate cyclase (GGDEF)-like protein/PAS domain S-box-containing protein
MADSQAKFGTQALLAQFDQLLSASPAVHYILSSNGPGHTTFNWFSDNLATVTGYPLVAALGDSWWQEHIHPDDRDRVLAAFDLLPRRAEVQCEYRFRFHQSGYRWIRDQRRLSGTVGDGGYEALGSWLDISDIHSTQSRLHEREQLLRKIIETEPECVKLVDLQGRILEINPAGLGMLQSADPGEIIGRPMQSFIAPEYHPRVRAVMQRVLSGEPAILEMEIIGMKGRRRRVESHAAPLYGPDGHVRSILTVTRDVSERADAESQVHYLAHYDLLTSLPNRALFRDRLLQAMAQAKRSDTLLAVMFLDIDHFKDVNDTLGHAIGDQLLKEISQRIRSCVRETDTVARFGGDEFGLIQTNLNTVEGAADLADRLIALLAQPYHIEGHEIHSAASIGVTIFPFDDHNAEDLLKNADMAMYKAKREGRSRYQFYIAELNQVIQRRAAIERDLRVALQKDQFRLHYQPQLDLSTGQVVGVEALLRWQHPERGDISPVEFIPVAESTSLILPIGDWVLRTACRQARAWQDAGLPPVRVAINLSAAQFRHRNLLETITEALTESRLDPHWLEVELTESLIMKDVRATIDTLRHLHELGVLISVDDFGTGYSSLSYLTRFPISKIKLDKSFVRDVDKKDGAAIARTVITLGHSLNMKVMAEGVETETQLRFLREHACNEVQGYYFGRPMPPGALERLLRDSLEELKARTLA